MRQEVFKFSKTMHDLIAIFLTCALFGQSKMTVISNLIVISLFLNALRSNLALEVKIKRKKSANIYSAQKLIFFIICYKREKFDSDFGHLLAKHMLKIGLP